MRRRARARLRVEWEQTAAITATIYTMLRGEDSLPADKLPPNTFNPMRE